MKGINESKFVYPLWTNCICLALWNPFVFMLSSVFQVLSLYKYSSYLFFVTPSAVRFNHSNSRLVKQIEIEFLLFSFHILMKRCYFINVNKINKSPVSIYSYSNELNRTPPNKWNIFLHLSKQRMNEWVNSGTIHLLFEKPSFRFRTKCTAMLFTVCLWWKKNNMHHFILPVSVAIVNDYSR